MEKLLIIDGNAIMHRAYHALPPLSKNGQVVNAVYGFFSMLIKILEEVKPTHIIVCFDRPKPTFRKMMYAGYQAGRPQMQNDLSSQFILMHEALEKCSIKIDEVDGYEADDLIGTLSLQAKEKEIETVIVSGDRDLLQLVNGHVKVLMPITGITKTILFDSQKVEEKYGIKPSQFIDYKALVGDTSDGYPGVSGIGPKTASTLLQKFGSFENMYKNLGEVPPKIAEKLATDAEQAALAKKLATIILDVPVKLDLKQCSLDEVTQDKVDKAFMDLGFNSIRERLSVFPQKNKQLELL